MACNDIAELILHATLRLINAEETALDKLELAFETLPFAGKKAKTGSNEFLLGQRLTFPRLYQCKCRNSRGRPITAAWCSPAAGGGRVILWWITQNSDTNTE